MDKLVTIIIVLLCVAILSGNRATDLQTPDHNINPLERSTK